jgi:hypothetical protein
VWRTHAELIKDESPLYLFDSQFGEKVPALLEDYQVRYTQEREESLLEPACVRRGCV